MENLEILSIDENDLLAMVQKSQVFKEFNTDQLRALSSNVQVVKGRPGSVVVREGGSEQHMFVLVEGSVEIFKESESGVPRKITRIQPGGFLGEMSLIDQLPYSATAVVAQTAVLLSVNSENLTKLLDEHPHIYNRLVRKIFRATSNRLRETTEALSKGIGRVADLTESLYEAIAKHREKPEVIATFSPSLKKPIDAIIGMSELFEEKARLRDAEENVDDLKRIQVAGRHMLELIDNILDYSQIERGKVALKLDLFEVGPLVEKVIAMMVPLAAANRNRLTGTCHPNTGEMIADPIKVKQAIINLVANSCKFTRGGFVSLEVAREQIEGRDFIKFAISDTGEGIPTKDIGLLLDTDDDADDEVTRSRLGLFVTRTFCTHMGGSLEVESEKDKGSTVIMYIPAHVQH